MATTKATELAQFAKTIEVDNSGNTVFRGNISAPKLSKRGRNSNVDEAQFADSDMVNGLIDSAFQHSKTSDDLSEGSTHLYYTTARADSDAKAAISVTDAGGDGSLSYSSGVITYTGPSAAETRAHFSGGTGVSISSGEVSIGQSVGTSDNVTFNNVTINGALTSDDITSSTVTASGNVIVQGNLTVNGTTTTVNSNTVNIGDNTIVLNADESGTPSQNAGIEIERGTSSNVSFIWDEANDRWTTGSNAIYTTGAITGATLTTTGNITVGGTVDGRDVATDGSKLDGIESGATADQTASEILTLIKTVDGSGSGLDADLLDGQNSGYYTSRITHVDGLTSSDNLNSLSSDYGWYKWASSVPSNAPDDYGIMLYLNDTSQPQQLVQTYGGATNKVRLFGRRKTSGVWDTSWTEYWSDKNDGSGSGLDADLLDGVEGSNYLRSNTSDTFNGILTVNASADYQIDLTSPDTWTGIRFNDNNANNDVIWHNGNNGTFAIGGSGSNVSGKKLHIDGGTSIGSSSDGTAVPTDGLYVQGDITTAGSVKTEGPDGGGFIGDWPNSGAYVMFGTANMTGQEYSVLTNGTDTFIGAGSGGSTHIRGPANDAAPQIKVTSSTVLFENGPVEIIDNTGLFIKTPTNGASADIKFSDAQSGNYNQVGTLSYRHADGAVTTVGGNSNDGFIFSGTESRTVVKVEGDIVATGTIYEGSTGVATTGKAVVMAMLFG